MVKCEMCGKVIIGTENKRFCASCFRERMRIWRRARQRAAATGNPVRKCFYCGKEFVGKNQQIVCPDCKSAHLRQASTAPQTPRHNSLCKPERTKKQKKQSSAERLGGISVAARAAGLTYGKYVAMKAGLLNV